MNIAAPFITSIAASDSGGMEFYMPGIFGYVGVDSVTQERYQETLMAHNKSDRIESIRIRTGRIGCVHLEKEELAVFENDVYGIALFGEIFSYAATPYFPKPLKSAKDILEIVQRDEVHAVEVMNGTFCSHFTINGLVNWF